MAGLYHFSSLKDRRRHSDMHSPIEMPAEEALEPAARCGAAMLVGRGPYEGQLTASDVGTGLTHPAGETRSRA